MAVSLVPRRRPGLLAVAQLAVALWLVAFTGCLCQPAYSTYPQPVPTYPTQPQPVPSYPTLPRASSLLRLLRFIFACCSTSVAANRRRALFPFNLQVRCGNAALSRRALVAAAGACRHDSCCAIDVKQRLYMYLNVRSSS
ncbi:hypothetical protein PVAP13_1KG118777 [Panicum virgatum]|uniref:Secreted protein n=1 Tax=Panicum virgatum TaxID=38727 RepID=A0A8T0X621_PANVG|nr:hypothetical protein PVAP13_1KG118777 [Panicum virgatum]